MVPSQYNSYTVVAIKRPSPVCPSIVDAEQTFRYISGRFVKQEETMGSLASQREIGVCVQAPGGRNAPGVATPRAHLRLCWGGRGGCPSRYGGLGYDPGKF